jgi:hypothetical protein
MAAEYRTPYVLVVGLSQEVQPLVGLSVKIVRADTGSQALAVLRRNGSPECIIAASTLSGISCWQLIQLIQYCHPETMCITVAGPPEVPRIFRVAFPIAHPTTLGVQVARSLGATPCPEADATAEARQCDIKWLSQLARRHSHIDAGFRSLAKQADRLPDKSVPI